MKKDKIEKIIFDTASSLGFSIYESSIVLRGDNSKISVKIDKIGTISFEDCEIFTVDFCKNLDNAMLVPNYSLEVSSPGLNRRLKGIEDFKRFKGENIKVIFDVSGNHTFAKGILLDVFSDKIVVKEEKKEMEISIKDIVSSNLDY